MVAPVLILLGFSGPAMAAVLPITGAYGNAAGCAFFLRGEAGPGISVLTGDSLASPAGSCDFVNFISRGEHEYVVEAACDGIGKIHEGLDRVTVREADEGLFVSIENAEVEGPLAPCPGAAEAMSPGVRI